MTVRKAIPAKKAATDADDTRYDFRNLVTCNADGSPRGGVTSPVGVALVTSTATMNVAVAGFSAVAVRDGGAILLANDGTVNVLLDAAPAANSRIDVIYVKQNDSSSTVTTPDANDTPVITFVKGTAAASPVKPAVPTGAVELATVQIPAGATATNAGGVVITQTAQFTAAPGGVVAVRNGTELTAFAAADSARAYRLDIGSEYQRIAGSWRPGGVQAPTDRPAVPVSTPTWALHSTTPMTYWVAGGMLHVSGIIVNSSAGTFGTTTDTLGTLPSGARPAVDRYVPAVYTIASGTARGTAIVRIASSGTITIARAASASVSGGDLWNIIECSVPLF